ncbi:nickel pincer cofactor biosynthesis protein LarC [bacterium]|nr:nickel pincer cofactor biosynthesis protein LarC [bacterium]
MSDSSKLPWTASRLLLVDAPAGISGDMFLSALADLGFELDELGELFQNAGFQVEIAAEETKRSGLRGRLLQLKLPENESRRGLTECLEVIDSLNLPGPVADLSRRYFELLGRVEARLHAVSLEKVHFHEIGAMDTLVDLVGAALGLYRLDIGRLHLRDLAVGRGTVKTEHGLLPLPAPATLELLTGFTLRESGLADENVTPTGAVILAGACERKARDQAFRPLRTGYGAGRRDLAGQPNLLRLTLAESADAFEGERDSVQVIRCAMDDITAEESAHLMSRLLEEGALDVNFRALQMKKGRPGLGLEVLCRANQLDELARLIFREGSTLGLRIQSEDRWILPRRMETVSTPYGNVRMKVAELPGGGEKASPEYEDCARLAREKGLTLMEVEAAARAAWRKDREKGVGA